MHRGLVDGMHAQSNIYRNAKTLILHLAIMVCVATHAILLDDSAMLPARSSSLMNFELVHVWADVAAHPG